ncbi:tail fiber protein [Paenibacillus dokdonensis]|uniref:tail fiber protein n=1 Tax=Paenibacillus dokdonensis TaxID=2567944 RepID=UPI001FE8F2FE|nr:tail fiber protein [Paenibacillus dokdonensis]
MPTNTPNLNLYKVNGETDGNETFNVDVVLNDNWDKIDAAVGNIKVPDASLTQKGIAKLSNAIGSDSETEAATPKAVHDATKYADTQIAYNKAQIQQDSKQDIRGLERELANLNLQLEASKRVPSGVTFGSNFADSFGMEIDTTQLTTKTALAVGQTDMPVDSIGTLKSGMEVTVYDDVNIERVKVTESGAVDTVADESVSDATVINAAYDTSGNGGRKLVRLSNGWLVACAYDSTESPKFYVSKDNGKTWAFLTRTPSLTNFNAICCKGTIVYMVKNSTTASGTGFVAFDATNVPSYIDNNTAVIENSQTAYSGVSITINEAGTELHVAVSSKNATYPNSFNIRYVKGTINADGTVTWAAVTQVSKDNQANFDYLNPSIVLDGSGQPLIFTNRPLVSGISSFIAVHRYTDSSWVRTYTTPSVEFSDYHLSPSAIFVPKRINGLENGRIWVAWHGKGSTSPTNDIMASFSDDSGVTWSSTLWVTNENNNQLFPSLTADKNGNVYIVWYGNTDQFPSTVIRYSKCVNGVWSGTTNVTNAASNNPSCLVDMSLDISVPIFIYVGTSVKVGFYGAWKTIVSVPTLKLAPLKKAYKEKAIIARTSAVIDTVNKCAKFGGWSTQTVNNVTDATVVNGSGYDTSGNGGRKLVRLSNGWLVATAVSGLSYLFYKSVDNGVTWSKIAYKTQTNTSGTTSIALVARNDTVYAIISFYTSAADQRIRYLEVDPIAETGKGVDIDPLQTSIGSVSLAINDAGTELHAAWSSKNSSYPNSSNIRYAKGIINADGSVTWGSAEQVTKDNNGSYNNYTPSIVWTPMGSKIISTYTTGSTFQLRSITTLGVAYSFYDSGSPSLGQYSPSAIYVPKSINGFPNGRIWVAWYGIESDSLQNIRIAYSDDGGVTWSAMQKLTSGSMNQVVPTITYNQKNEIFILFHGGVTSGGYFQIRKISYKNSSWGSITTLTSTTTSHAANPSSLVGVGFDFSEPLFIYKNMQTNNVGFFGTWTATGETPLLENDIRFKVKDTDEAVTWVQHDAGITVSAALTGQTMDKTTAGNEDQFVKALTVSGPAEIRLTMKRSSTSDDVKINKILGGVG